jgi:hypothetical protein
MSFSRRDLEAECAARLNLLEVMAARYAGPVSERMFGGQPNHNTEDRAEHDDQMASWQLDLNGVAPSGDDRGFLKTRGRSWAEKLLRRHEARIGKVANRLLQPPHKLNPARFKQLMRERPKIK